MFELRYFPLPSRSMPDSPLEEALRNAPSGAPYISVVYTAPRNHREKGLFSLSRYRQTRDEEENAENIN